MEIQWIESKWNRTIRVERLWRRSQMNYIEIYFSSRKQKKSYIRTNRWYCFDAVACDVHVLDRVLFKWTQTVFLGILQMNENHDHSLQEHVCWLWPPVIIDEFNSKRILRLFIEASTLVKTNEWWLMSLLLFKANFNSITTASNNLVPTGAGPYAVRHIKMQSFQFIFSSRCRSVGKVIKID